MYVKLSDDDDGEGGAGAAFGGERPRHLLPGVLLEGHLAVEGVEVAGAAVGEEVDHRARPGREMRRTRRERPREPLGGRNVPARLGLEQARGAEPAEAEAGAEQGVASGH